MTLVTVRRVADPLAEEEGARRHPRVPGALTPRDRAGLPELPPDMRDLARAQTGRAAAYPRLRERRMTAGAPA